MLNMQHVSALFVPMGQKGKGKSVIQCQQTSLPLLISPVRWQYWGNILLLARHILDCNCLGTTCQACSWRLNCGNSMFQASITPAWIWITRSVCLMQSMCHYLRGRAAVVLLMRQISCPSNSLNLEHRVKLFCCTLPALTQPLRLQA